jgi:hypothetical protein
MGKYDAWDGFFAGLEGDEAELSFEQLEEIIGAELQRRESVVGASSSRRKHQASVDRCSRRRPRAN